MSSSSSWGSPEKFTPEDDRIPQCNESRDVTPGPSALEAVRIYDSPKCGYSPGPSITFSDVGSITTTAEEDEFLYGFSSVNVLQEEVLKTSPIEDRKPTGLEWSDEEEGNGQEISDDACEICQSERFETDIADRIKVEKSETYEYENPNISKAEHAEQLPSRKQEKCSPKSETKEMPTRNVPFQCHEILSAIWNSNESEKHAVQKRSENQENFGAINKNVNNNMSSQKDEPENSQQYVASQGTQEQCTKKSSDLEKESSILAASFINAFMGEAKSNSSGSSEQLGNIGQPTRERSILLKHSKTSSQTEKIVLKTCSKTSSTIANYRSSPKSFPQKQLDTINKYLINNLKDSSRNSNDTRSDYVQESKPVAFACKSSSRLPDFKSFHQSSLIRPPVQYQYGVNKYPSQIRPDNPGNVSGKGYYSRDRSPIRRSRDRSPIRRSRDRSPIRRSRDCSPRRRSRSKSNSYDSSPGHRSRERTSRYDSRGSQNRGRCGRRSPYRCRSSRRRSRDRSDRPHSTSRDRKYRRSPDRPRRFRRSTSRDRSRDRRYHRSRDRSERFRHSRSRDRSRDRKYRRSKSSECEKRSLRSPYHSYSRRRRSWSKESSNTSFSSSDS